MKCGKWKKNMCKETKMYNKDSIDKEIKKDPRISKKESKLIHALLKGRG